MNEIIETKERKENLNVSIKARCGSSGLKSQHSGGQSQTRLCGGNLSQENKQQNREIRYYKKKWKGEYKRQGKIKVHKSRIRIEICKVIGLINIKVVSTEK